MLDSPIKLTYMSSRVIWYLIDTSAEGTLTLPMLSDVRDLNHCLWPNRDTLLNRKSPRALKIAFVSKKANHPRCHPGLTAKGRWGQAGGNLYSNERYEANGRR